MIIYFILTASCISNVSFIQAEMKKNVYNLYPKGFFIAELAYRQNINPMLSECKYSWEFTADLNANYFQKHFCFFILSEYFPELKK